MNRTGKISWWKVLLAFCTCGISILFLGLRNGSTSKLEGTARKKVLRFLLIWFLAAIPFYLLATLLFPVDSDNNLQIPDAYSVLMFFVSLSIAFILQKKKFSDLFLRNPNGKTNSKKYSYQPITNLYSNDKSHKVVIVRKSTFASSAKKYTVFLDGNQVAILPNGGNVSFIITPGNHKIDFKGYFKIETSIDVFVDESSNITRLFTRVSLKTGKLLVENANGPEYDSYFLVKTLAASPRPSATVQHAASKPKPVPCSTTMSHIDKMDGHDFEHFTAELLKKLGYERVEVTPSSGDQGVDVIAVKDGKKYAIQCKRYGQKLGNKPVQEVHAGKTIYGCSVAVVLTNNYFTEGGKEAARALGVELWDRDKLERMLTYAAHMAGRSTC